MIPQTINEKDFCYNLPHEKDFNAQQKQLEENIQLVINKLNIPDYEIEINYPLLGGLLVRIDERKDYYRYFHSTEDTIMKISRSKELALLAYWIVKYKPFRVKGISNEERFYEEFICSFNEVFAAIIIIAFVQEETDCDVDFFTDNKINTLVYDLFNRDISKEAMIMYVESFVKDATVS